MGASSSAPASASITDLGDDEQRLLMRNVAFLASRDTAEPGKFCRADWREVHAAMPARLAEALWRALHVGSPAGGEYVDLNDVVRIVVPLRSGPSPPPAPAAQAHLAATGLDAPTAASVANDEAAPWLASLGLLSSAADVASRSAAQLIAQAAASAWVSVDLRDLEPLPHLTEGTPRLLTDSGHVRLLARALPSEERRRWRLLFSTSRDGCSFTRFVGLGANRAPCLVVIRDTAGALFGGYSASPLTVSSQFSGSYGSFLFSLAPTPAVHRASGDSPNLVYLNAGMEVLPNGLAFGGNLEARFFGLWLRDDLESGRSCGPCATYSNSPCLASATEFEVAEVELWAVADDPPPPTEEEAAADAGVNPLTEAGVLSSKHQETRNFLAMAGRTQHAANLGPAPE